MATRTRTVSYMVSDLSGVEITPVTGRPVLMKYQGRRYDLDLTNEEADALDDLLRPYLDAARKGPAPRSTIRRKVYTEEEVSALSTSRRDAH